jgi:hypothetical protein
MTPYEISKMVHRELSTFAPRLSAALNRALVDIGEGSVLVGLGTGTHENDDISFQEAETIDLRKNDAANILSKISTVVSEVEDHSSWKVFTDKKPGSDPQKLELLYTIFRSKKR